MSALTAPEYLAVVVYMLNEKLAPTFVAFDYLSVKGELDWLS